MHHTLKHILFVILFAILGFVALQVPVARIVGSDQNFTLFDFFAPVTGLFLTSIPGALSVLLVKIVDIIYIKHQVDWVSIARLAPLPLAAWYFGSQFRGRAGVALVCMVLFILHPIGREAWQYSMYWWIPVLAVFFPQSLFFRSLGSTFTAHAVGGVVFLYAFNLPASLWLGLIPVVFVERMLFAGGIWLSFFIFNYALHILVDRLHITFLNFLIQRQYLPSINFVKKHL